MDTTTFLQVGEARLAYKDWGGQGTPLLLVHGLASGMHIWDSVAPTLAEHFKVFAYSQRGHGESSDPENKFTLDVMLAELAGVLDALELRRAIIVGHSWGANLALAFAAKHPGRCAGVALVDGGLLDLKGDPPASWETISTEMAPPDMSKMLLSEVLAWAHDLGLQDTAGAPLRDYYLSIMNLHPDGTVRNKLSRKHHMEILEIIYNLNAAEQLGKAQVPILAVLAGEEAPGEDRYTQGKWRGVQLIKEHSGARAVWISDSAHDIPLHKPEQLASEIIRFFEGEGEATR